jgi:predicted dehydrogenase
VELRVGVVGVGVMGTYHAQNYAGLPGVRLVGVADPNPLRRRAIEQELEVPAFPEAELLLGQVDAVSIASPTSLHFAQAKMFLQAGVHVLLEKPMTSSLPEARHLVALAEERGLILQVGHIMRFYRAISELTRMAHSPWFLEARRMGNNRRIRDIGAILDLMIHDLDLALLLLKEWPVRWSVVGQQLEGLEEHAHAVLDFPSGARAVFTASRISPQLERSFTVTQQAEVIRLEFNSDHTEVAVHRLIKGESNDEREQVRVERTSFLNENPLRRQLRHFVDRIVKGRPPFVTLEDDLRALELALLLSEELKPGRAANYPTYPADQGSAVHKA